MTSQECSQAPSGRACVDNSSCNATNTCDIGQGKCRISNAVCSSDAQCVIDLTDICQPIEAINYERIKVLSGAQVLKLGPGKRVYQGNYPKAEKNKAVSPPIFVAGNSQISLSGYLNTTDLKDGAARVKIQEYDFSAISGNSPSIIPPTEVMEADNGRALEILRRSI